MMLIISTQYKHALTNYGFSQGDIGKAMIVFADARSAARGVIGYNDTDMIATMKQIHDEKKQKFDDYWAIVANTCVTGTEKDLYEQVNTLVQQYWDAEAQAMEIGASTDDEDSIKAQQIIQFVRRFTINIDKIAIFQYGGILFKITGSVACQT